MASTNAANRFIERLAALTEGLQALRAGVLDRHGLADCWYELLRGVAAHGEAGCSQKELAEQLGLAESRVCGLVDQLYERGLLHRFRSKKDRRRSVLLLSQSGRETVGRCQSEFDAALASLLADTSDEAIEVVVEWLEVLRSRINPGQCIPSDTPHGAVLEEQPVRYREAG